MYYIVYSGISDLILVLRSIYKYYGFYTCIIELILVLRNVYLYIGAHPYISNLILVLRSICMYYGTYTCIIEHILILRILFLCKGTRRYDKSEQIRIILHTRSYQTYVDTYQIWTLVHSRYKSQQIHIPDSYRFKIYPNTNRLSVYIIIIFRVIQFLMLITGLCLFGSPIGVTKLILM